jgi:hypothetical protein
VATPAQGVPRAQFLSVERVTFMVERQLCKAKTKAGTG